MRDLYSTATSAIAWLGEGDVNSDLVYSAMLAPRDSLGDSNDGTRQELVNLLNRPYWSRVWVIQEFILPLNLIIWWNGYRVKAQDVCSYVRISTDPGRIGSLHLYHLTWNRTAEALLRYRENYHGMGHRKYCQGMFDSFDAARSQELRATFRLRLLLDDFSKSQCTVSLQTPTLGSSRKLLEETISAMGREPGCLMALQDHIDYYTSPDPVGNLLGEKIRSFSIPLGGTIPTRIEMCGSAMVPSNYQIKKLPGTDLPRASQIESLIVKLSFEKWVAISETDMIGVKSTTSSKNTSKCDHCTCQGQTIFSCSWFGRYGTALVMECAGCQGGEYAFLGCDGCEWRIVGTAFICQPEAARFHK